MPLRQLHIALVLCMAVPQALGSQPVAPGSRDPVTYATDLIRRTSAWWNDLGYITKVGQYRVGWLAAPGIAYGLTAAPSVAIAAITQGVPGAASTVAGDAIFGVLELAVGSPDLAARRLATGVRDLSLAEYAAAKELAAPVLRGGTLTGEQAQRFLALRWGVLRLEIAGELFRSTNSLSGFQRRTGDAAAWSAVSELADAAQLRATGRTLPVVEAVELTSRALTILQQAGVGLGAHPGYQRYIQRLATLEAQRAAELASLRSGAATPTSPASGASEVRHGGRALRLVQSEQVTRSDGSQVRVSLHGLPCAAGCEWESLNPSVLLVEVGGTGRAWREIGREVYECIVDTPGLCQGVLAERFSLAAPSGQLLAHVPLVQQAGANNISFGEALLIVLPGEGGLHPVFANPLDAAVARAAGVQSVSKLDRQGPLQVDARGVVVNYLVWRGGPEGDARCCPTGGTVRVTYELRGVGRAVRLVPVRYEKAAEDDASDALPLPALQPCNDPAFPTDDAVVFINGVGNSLADGRANCDALVRTLARVGLADKQVLLLYNRTQRAAWDDCEAAIVRAAETSRRTGQSVPTRLVVRPVFPGSRTIGPGTSQYVEVPTWALEAGCSQPRDLAEAVSQIQNVSAAYTSAPQPDALHTERLLRELLAARRGRVAVVAHSQGNLMFQEGVLRPGSAVASSERRRLGWVSVAAPVLAQSPDVAAFRAVVLAADPVRLLVARNMAQPTTPAEWQRAFEASAHRFTAYLTTPETQQQIIAGVRQALGEAELPSGSLVLDRAAEPLLRGCEDSPLEIGLWQTLRRMLTPDQGEVAVSGGRVPGLSPLLQGYITGVGRKFGVDEEQFWASLQGARLWGYPVTRVESYVCRDSCGISGMLLQVAADSATVAREVASRGPQRRSLPASELEIRVYAAPTGGALVVCDRST
jgi:hypothetical protein